MKIAKTIEEIRNVLAGCRQKGISLGFVPTMGALHEGHLSLARKARQENDINVMSIFVNPTQFGPQEDFGAYPREITKDLELAQSAGVDAVFLPTTEEMYPEGLSTFIEEEKLSQPLCGAVRPGHFRGVCTIVLKLLHVVQPTRMYLGQKDAQQLRVLEKMVEDLNLEVELVGCPIIREKDGLAMSSRNVYLNPNQREGASRLYQGLKQAQALFDQGERSSKRLVEAAEMVINQEPLLKIEYLELRRWIDLGLTLKVKEKSLLAVAAHAGKTRLIDNLILLP